MRPISAFILIRSAINSNGACRSAIARGALGRVITKRRGGQKKGENSGTSGDITGSAGYLRHSNIRRYSGHTKRTFTSEDGQEIPKP